MPVPNGAGPPLGHEAAPSRAVLRRGLIAICATCCHAKPVWIVCNETRVLSLMSALRVNSGTQAKPVFGTIEEKRESRAPIGALYWIAVRDERQNERRSKAQLAPHLIIVQPTQ
jgi:hypothetical protein